MEEGVMEGPEKVVIGQRVQEAKVISSRRKLTPRQIIDGFIADFYCHSAALVIEADGPVHDPEYDAERDRVFAARSIRVLRFTNRDIIERVGFVLSRIRHHLEGPPSWLSSP